MQKLLIITSILLLFTFVSVYYLPTYADVTNYIIPSAPTTLRVLN